MTTCYVEGIALDIGWADARRDLTEMVFQTVRRSLDDARRPIGDVDSVVLAAHDLVDGRSLSSMVSAPAAGAYLRDEIRLGDDGAAAFSLACARLEAGEARCSIVAAWGRASEGDQNSIARALFDPISEAPFGLTELAVSGLRAGQWLSRHGQQAGERLAAARRRASQARANPRSLPPGESGGRAPGGADPPYPLRDGELPRWADVAVAVIVSDRPAAVRVAGIGHGSEPYSAGERDLAGLPGLTLAVHRAMPAGGSVAAVDVVELDGLTVFDEALACEAAGLAAPGQGLRAMAGDGRINPSGGSAAGYCAPAMGLARVAEASLQLRGTAGAVQQGRPRLALASGSSTVAGQTHVAVLLEAS